MLRAALGTFVVSGCDYVFRIDRLEVVAPDATTQLGCDAMHDEDGDGHGDGCDRCPGIADVQADSDRDGVGDACDPSPLTSDELVLFESFVNDDDWRVVAGTWKPDGESYGYESLELASYGIALSQTPLPEPPFVVEYHYAVEHIAAQASALAVIVDSDSSGKGVTCGNVRHEGPVRDVVRSTFAAATLSSELPIRTVTNGGYRVVVSYDGAEIRCALSADNGSTSGATTLALPQRPPAGQLGFRSLRVGAKLHYVAVYKAR